jgi:hypothetical protein
MIGAPFDDLDGPAAGLQGFCLDMTAVQLTASQR